jgi:hypothetical protein
MAAMAPTVIPPNQNQKIRREKMERRDFLKGLAATGHARRASARANASYQISIHG